MKFSRRKALQAVSASALSPLAAHVLSAAQIPAPPKEGKGTPKIAVGMGDGGGAVGGRGANRGANDADRSAAARRIRQLGVDNVLSGGPQMLPWTTESLTAMMEPWKAAGVEVSNLMINVSGDIIYGKTGNRRDEDIEKVKQSIVAAGKAYGHRGPDNNFLIFRWSFLNLASGHDMYAAEPAHHSDETHSERSHQAAR